MQSCRSWCAQLGVAVAAGHTCGYLVPNRRSYSAPAHSVNATDLPDPRRTTPNLSPHPSFANPHHTRDGGFADHHSSSSTSSTSSGDGRHAFTKLDLQNPPQMPSPTYYATYEEYLDAYDHYLHDADHYTTSARVFVQKRLASLRATQRGMAEVVRREYLWTFIPLLFCLSVFMIDRSNHSAAAFTHRIIKERTKQHVKHVKWKTV
jgi:hypothetical protein